MKKPDRPTIPPQKSREAPKYAGDIEKLCSNCQHFGLDAKSKRDGDCHNGISGRLRTRSIDGCAFGFYPSVERFPLLAGAGGSR